MANASSAISTVTAYIRRAYSYMTAQEARAAFTALLQLAREHRRPVWIGDHGQCKLVFKFTPPDTAHPAVTVNQTYLLLYRGKRDLVRIDSPKDIPVNLFGLDEEPPELTSSHRSSTAQ